MKALFQNETFLGGILPAIVILAITALSTTPFYVR